MFLRNFPVNDQEHPFGKSHGTVEPRQPVRAYIMCACNMLDVSLSSCRARRISKDLERRVETSGRSGFAEQLRSNITAG
jgi:hypothetical protein